MAVGLPNIATLLYYDASKGAMTEQEAIAQSRREMQVSVGAMQLRGFDDILQVKGGVYAGTADLSALSSMAVGRTYRAPASWGAVPDEIESEASWSPSPTQSRPPDAPVAKPTVTDPNTSRRPDLPEMPDIDIETDRTL